MLIFLRCKRLSGAGSFGDGPVNTVEDEHDFAADAKLLLEAIKITGERFGLGMPIMFLTGSVS